MTSVARTAASPVTTLALRPANAATRVALNADAEMTTIGNVGLNIFNRNIYIPLSFVLRAMPTC